MKQILFFLMLLLSGIAGAQIVNIPDAAFTGTAPAMFIAVKDIIDESKFDLSSLQVMYASHEMETRITGNKVEFYFGDINLAALGKGNVTFKIKTLNTLQVMMM